MTTDQALAVSKKYLVPANMVVVAVGDRKVIEPELAKLGVGKVEIRDTEGRPARSSRFEGAKECRGFSVTDQEDLVIGFDHG